MEKPYRNRAGVDWVGRVRLKTINQANVLIVKPMADTNPKPSLRIAVTSSL